MVPQVEEHRRLSLAGIVTFRAYPNVRRAAVGSSLKVIRSAKRAQSKVSIWEVEQFPSRIQITLGGCPYRKLL